METQKMEVMFGDYCRSCKYREREGSDPPCDECLETWYRDSTRVPINYEKQEKSQ